MPGSFFVQHAAHGEAVLLHVVHDVHLAAGFHAERVAVHGALAAARPVTVAVRNQDAAAVDVATVAAQGQIYRYAVVAQDADIRAVFLALQVHGGGGTVEKGFHLDVRGDAPAFRRRVRTVGSPAPHPRRVFGLALIPVAMAGAEGFGPFAVSVSELEVCAVVQRVAFVQPQRDGYRCGLPVGGEVAVHPAEALDADVTALIDEDVFHNARVRHQGDDGVAGGG